MWKVNSCPRCGNDVFIYETVDNSLHAECFQCGYKTKPENVAGPHEKDSRGIVVKSQICSKLNVQ